MNTTRHNNTYMCTTKYSITDNYSRIFIANSNVFLWQLKHRTLRYQAQSMSLTLRQPQTISYVIPILLGSTYRCWVARNLLKLLLIVPARGSGGVPHSLIHAHHTDKLVIGEYLRCQAYDFVPREYQWIEALDSKSWWDF